MDIGASKPLRRARVAIHSYSRVHTRDAVAGGSSQNTPYGSAFSTTYPPRREVMRYLYPWPRSAVTAVPSQIPDPSARGTRGLSPAFQPFQSPITDTASASPRETGRYLDRSAQRGWFSMHHAHLMLAGNHRAPVPRFVSPWGGIACRTIPGCRPSSVGGLRRRI